MKIIIFNPSSENLKKELSEAIIELFFTFDRVGNFLEVYFQ